MIKQLLTQPWPWYVAGPLLGLVVPLLLLLGNKQFGISSTLRDICTLCLPTKVKFFQYNAKEQTWNLVFVLGIALGGFVGRYWLSSQAPLQLAARTVEDLKELGISDFNGLLPKEIFSWQQLSSPKTILCLVMGGFLVGFGVRYAGGCTSGHGVMGLAQLSVASLVAVIGFFLGGLLMTHLLFPLLFTR